MSKSSEILVLLLVSITTPFTQNFLVLGSSISDRIARRPDPLSKFKHYGGNYDITNKHYWASAAFTGIHGYAVGGVWLLSGVGFGIFIVARNSGGRTPPVVDHPNSSNLIMFLLLLLFTIFAISASSFVMAASHKSLRRAEKLEQTVFGAGDDASQTIRKVKATLRRMQTFLLPYDSQTCHLLDLIQHRLRKVSLNINSFIHSNTKYWDRAIQTLYVVNLVVVSINLALLVAGLVLLTLQHRPAILVLIFSFWIVTTLSWILTGVDFFFYTFIGDTCATLKNFEEDPQNNNLTDMLPCPNSTVSVEILEEINNSVRSFIAQINSKIQQVLEINYDIQSVPEVCDPFSSAPDYTYSPQICGKNSIPIGDLPRVLSRFICYNVSTSKDCLQDGRFLPEAIYPISLAYSRSIQDFINIYPDLSSLMKCSPVRRTFSDIAARQCGPILTSTFMLWLSMLALSLVMMVLILFWSIFSRSVQGS